jgi:glycosyltransferase involved in cell wall biosynthesis
VWLARGDVGFAHEQLCSRHEQRFHAEGDPALRASVGLGAAMRIALVAHASCDAHVQMGYVADRFVVIPNGFDFAVFHPDRRARSDLREELRLPVDASLVGVIGRFDVQKNQEGFCVAMAPRHPCGVGRARYRRQQRGLDGLDGSRRHHAPLSLVGATF